MSEIYDFGHIVNNVETQRYQSVNRPNGQTGEQILDDLAGYGDFGHRVKYPKQIYVSSSFPWHGLR
jgi:hypothetical protein